MKYGPFAGNDKLHPIQYYHKLPSKSDNKLISLLICKEARGNIELDGVRRRLQKEKKDKKG